MSDQQYRSDDGEDARKILDALQRCEMGHEDGMVVNFVCVFESIDAEGRHWFHQRFGPGTTKWAAKGMLVHALDDVRDDEVVERIHESKGD